MKIASIGLLIVFMIADAKCNQLGLEAEQSKGNPTLTINTNSNETIVVTIYRLHNNAWSTHKYVSVHLGNSRTIAFNQEYPYYFFSVSSHYGSVGLCKDTLEKAFKFQKNTKATLNIHSSIKYITDSNGVATYDLTAKCSFSGMTKSTLTWTSTTTTSTTGTIIVSLTVAFLSLVSGYLILRYCIPQTFKNKIHIYLRNIKSRVRSTNPQNTNSRPSPTQFQYRTQNDSIEIESGRTVPEQSSVSIAQNDELSLEANIRSYSAASRPILPGEPSMQRETNGDPLDERGHWFNSENYIYTFPIAGQNFEQSRSTPIQDRYADSTVTYKYVKISKKEGCTICCCEFEENQIVR